MEGEGGVKGSNTFFQFSYMLNRRRDKYHIEMPSRRNDFFKSYFRSPWFEKGLPFSTYALRGREGGLVSYTFPLHINAIPCKTRGSGGGGEGSR